MLSSLSSAFDLLLVIIGFGMVIFIHELGHFLAAKWAGVSVHQFAIGFGSAACSYRKGIGFRVGSSEGEYQKILTDDAQGVSSIDSSRVSMTEYRINWFPFGGYVKMLGQEDLNPTATNQSPDSYTQKPVWKRMVIISAGVVMNMILAAALFVVVFMVGRVVPTPKIGFIAPNSPASKATLVAGNPSSTPASLEPGDDIVEIGGRKPRSFSDVSLAVVMASPNDPLTIVVNRWGVVDDLAFEVTPRKSNVTHMLEIGVGPASSNTIIKPPIDDPAGRQEIRAALEITGLIGVDPGMTLISVNGDTEVGLWTLESALSSSNGAPVRAVFQNEQGSRAIVDVMPAPVYQTAVTPIAGYDDTTVQLHLLGLAPAVKVGIVTEPSAQKILKTGDVLVQVGAISWPDIASTIAEIRRRKNSDINLTVLRDGKYVDLTAPVDKNGRIGFGVMSAERTLSTISRVPVTALGDDASSERIESTKFAAARLNLRPGSTIVRVNDQPVSSFSTLRAALRKATQDAYAQKAGAEVALEVRLPIGDDYTAGPETSLKWSLTADDVQTLHKLGWRSPVNPLLFELDTTLDQTSNPVEAVGRGIAETRRMMITTYLTFVRLFQGTVQVDQLKGPVGIAHLGTQIVDQGFLNLLFFLGLISVNLAVINFLPIPIADGGHFVMLAIEQVTGKPVSPVIENITSLAGLALIATVFIVVTYNDIAALIGG